jgi:signal transduction histidine kinase
MSAFPKLDLSRTFTPDDRRPPLPSDEDIEWALAAMRKVRKEDRLDCGACGYDTCRDKAVAVCQGLAEPEMCLPYLVDELQETVLNLKETNVQLESAQKQLVKSERLASMGQLSAGIAHELNNPLGTVLLYSHMLMRDLKEDPRKADVQMIVSEAVRCKDIVRGLLDFARQSRVSKAPCDVAEMLGEVVSIAELKAQGAGVTVTADVRGEMPVMMIDRVQIRQALVNLVNNGIDSIEGGGEIRIAAWQHPSGSDLFLEVRDTGCGIPPENLARLFTPFFTTKAGTKGGTGLGLAITYGVIKMHSGDITVDSEVGKGTVFTIRLPVRTADGKPVGTDPVGTDFKVEEQFFR